MNIRVPSLPVRAILPAFASLIFVAALFARSVPKHQIAVCNMIYPQSQWSDRQELPVSAVEDISPTPKVVPLDRVGGRLDRSSVKAGYYYTRISIASTTTVNAMPLASGYTQSSEGSVKTTITVAANSATINGETVYQTISGWGASTGYNERNNNLTPAQADCFFSTSNGSCASGPSIGLSWIRIQDNRIPNNAPDLPTLRLAVARGAQVELGFNPHSAINSSNYLIDALYDVAKTRFFQANGVPIAAISPINEPVNSRTTGVAIDSFVASYLYPALESAGLGSIPITLPESSDWFLTDYVTPCMEDSACSSHVSAVSGHGYYYGAQGGSIGVDGFAKGAQCCVDYAANPPPASTAGKAVWQTEVNGGVSWPCSVDSGLAPYDPSMIPDALVYAHNIHDFLTVLGGSQWLYWNLAAETANGSTPCNDGLTDQSYHPAKRFYAIGNFSKFVRPGWVRIGATADPQSGVYVTAFKSGKTGAFAIVAINTNSRPVTQPFSLRGLSANSLTLYITDASNDLAAQFALPVSDGNFTATLNASSVTTFVH